MARNYGLETTIVDVTHLPTNLVKNGMLIITRAQIGNKCMTLGGIMYSGAKPKVGCRV
jgi:hypothetical protein